MHLRGAIIGAEVQAC